MALGFRLYQLFRSFWVQNTLAFVLGGVICFAMLFVFESSALIMQALKRTQHAFYIQILPRAPNPFQQEDQPDAQGAQGLTEIQSDPYGRLLLDLRKLFPQLHVEQVEDKALVANVLSEAGFPLSYLKDFSLNVPHTYFKATLRSQDAPKLALLLDKVRSVPGVHRVQADMNILETVQHALWLVPLLSGLSLTFLLLFLFYVLQFVLSQMIVVRRQEIQLEYLLGATRGYQKHPYLVFILLFVFCSVGLALMAWVFWIVPNLTNVLQWLSGFGFGQDMTFQVHNPKLLFLFVPSFLLLVVVLFHMSWHYHFRRIIWNQR